MSVEITALVVGSGGREHAIGLALARDPEVKSVVVAPGNPGTWDLATSYGYSQNQRLWERIVTLDQLDGIAVRELAQEIGANLVIIGPEAPLVAGVADDVRAVGIACFGPSASAAQLEGSKQFAKEVMARADVPTARSHFCRNAEEVGAALDEFGPPYVVKDDGLAAGKGVIVTDDREEALAHAASCEAVVIEEFLDGPEVSLFAICDGHTAVPLLPAQDFKRVGDGDTGPNTGGMGAYCPLPWAPPELVEETMTRVIRPTVAQMERRGTPFVGLMYAGLALTSHGLRVVEFNARFGDPETEAILPLLSSGLGQVLYAASTGTLDQIPELTWENGYSVMVVYAANGYPGVPYRGGLITLPAPVDGGSVIHAGTAIDSEGHLVSHGGRVLGAVAQGATLTQARHNAYALIDSIDFPDGFYRHDIAEKAELGKITTPVL